MNEQAKDFGSVSTRMAEMTDVVLDQIRRLAEAHQEGILTDEEFSAKKADLLRRL